MRAMAIHPAYAQVSALLVAVFILIAGNGLSNTLVPLSATAQSFPPLSIGLIGSAYFGGMLIGCLAAPRIIARAGHIRAFSAFVAVSTVAALMHPMFVDPAAWCAIRNPAPNQPSGPTRRFTATVLSRREIRFSPQLSPG